jgi:hypothetical protein
MVSAMEPRRERDAVPVALHLALIAVYALAVIGSGVMYIVFSNY